MHKHTGFIIAIVITVILLLVAAVLGYLSYDQSLKVAEENVNLQQNNSLLQQQNSELQDALNAEIERPGPIPFYYAHSNEAFVEPTEIRAVDAITGDETVVATIEGYYRVIAQPRTGWSNLILLDRLIESDNPGYTPFLFDVTSGDALTPAPLGDVQPFGRSSMIISPSEQYAFAVYPPSDELDEHVAFLDLISGEKTIAQTIPVAETFAADYSEFGGIGNYTMSWTSQDCVRIARYVYPEPENPDVAPTFTATSQYCLSDYMTE